MWDRLKSILAGALVALFGVAAWKWLMPKGKEVAPSDHTPEGRSAHLRREALLADSFHKAAQAEALLQKAAEAEAARETNVGHILAMSDQEVADRLNEALRARGAR